ncbi:MAG: VWA domain-containing protein [Bryobacterales bacterium]|nr:VWA domain-containing protein [Bryobacterales bacterium]
MKATVRLLAGLVLASALAFGQDTDAPVEDSGFVIRTESNLVVVPLHVYQKRQSVNGLGKESFELFEDGVKQDIAFVEGPAVEGAPEGAARSVPTEIIFLIDFSLSVMMRNLLDFTSIRTTLLEGLRKDVMISVYGFADSLKRFTGPTRDFAKLKRAIELTYESEALGSRVYEAIIQTARDASNRGGNVSRMMLVFSDGFSTTGLSPDIVVQVANALAIPIYPVILGHSELTERYNQGGGGGAWRQPRQPTPGQRRSQIPGGSRNPAGLLRRQSNIRDRESRQAIFADVGPRTGGQSFDPEVLNNLVIRKILGSLADLAETEYIVGYYPSSVDDELTAHQVQVRLVDEEAGKLYGGQRTIVH